MFQPLLLLVLTATGQPATDTTPVQRQIMVEKHYLHMPIGNDVEAQWMTVTLDGKIVREYLVALAQAEPDYWVFTSVEPFVGKTLAIEYPLPAGSKALDAIVQSDELPSPNGYYHEYLRPQFHFTTRVGWLNDPNGLVYCDGEYHLFYQHNPFNVNSGYKVWGHAVSADMLHWRELDTAIQVDEHGMVFSGSAVVDEGNTAGFQQGDEKPIVAVYTSAPEINHDPWSAGKKRSQSVAYSTDHGRHFTPYSGNPVVANIYGKNRDPKVFWHEPSRQWVMMLYMNKDWFDLLGSPDLKQWQVLSKLDFPGGHECPDLFELAVDGNPHDTRWVAWDGNGLYMIGHFDGRQFDREDGPFTASCGNNDYAAQTFNHMPDGRVVQIAWMLGGKYPDMPFNQQMTIPRELSLRRTEEGLRLFTQPAREVETLRANPRQWRNIRLTERATPITGFNNTADLEMEIDLQQSKRVALELPGGAAIEYDATAEQLKVMGKDAPLKPIDGRIRLRVVLDRTSVEVFANDGLVQSANCYLPQQDKRALSGSASGGEARITLLKLWDMRSVWE